MSVFVGVTDYDWYRRLSAVGPLDEVNFWSPGGMPFRRLAPGELFLFKLKARHGHMVVGGGVFAHDTLLPLSLAWEAFQEKNGVGSFAEMLDRILKYRRPEDSHLRDPVIGCRLVQQPFFLEPRLWFRVPESYPVNAVSGKTYAPDSPEAAYLHRALDERLPWGTTLRSEAQGFQEEPRTGKPQTILPRLGQGTFRVAVLDSYERRCAITGERTIPIVDAAHIKPWAIGGEQLARNGIAMRTDIHRLFDLGYVTVSEEMRFEVSSKLREDYENGVHYYALHGSPLRLPNHPEQRPSLEAIRWHHENKWARPGSLI